jgi:hypothetical protein
LMVWISDTCPVLHCDLPTLQTIDLTFNINDPMIVDHYEHVPFPQGKCSSCIALALESDAQDLRINLNVDHLPSLQDLTLGGDVTATGIKRIPRLHLHTPRPDLVTFVAHSPMLSPKLASLELPSDTSLVVSPFVNLGHLEMVWSTLQSQLPLLQSRLQNLTSLAVGNVADGTAFLRAVAKAFPRLTYLGIIHYRRGSCDVHRLHATRIMPNLTRLDVPWFHLERVDTWARCFPRLQLVLCNRDAHSRFPIGPLWHPGFLREPSDTEPGHLHRLEQFKALVPKRSSPCSGLLCTSV